MSQENAYLDLLRQLKRTRDLTASPAGRSPSPKGNFSYDYPPPVRHPSPTVSYPPPPAVGDAPVTLSADLGPRSLPAPTALPGESSQPENMDTANGYPYSPEFENAVIAKQRRELHMLVDELRERDKELNDMVSSHQRQMAGWEADRRLVLQLEEKTRALEALNADRQAQITNLNAKVEAAEQTLRERQSQLMDFQARTDSMHRDGLKQKEFCSQLEGMHRAAEKKNDELAAIIRSLESRELTLKDGLAQKEAALEQSRREHQDASGRNQALEAELARSSQTNSSLKAQLHDLSAQAGDLKKEVERYKVELNRRHGEIRDYHQRLERKEQELMQAKKDVQLGVERERRKDELIQSQKLKVERSDSELNHLRHLYERMQKDLTTLHSSLESSKEMLLAESSALVHGKHSTSSAYGRDISESPVGFRPLH